MSDSNVSDHPPTALSHEEMMSALFAQMVMQQSSLAMMLLGKTPHPESGQTLRDLEGARLMIDQLEMLEVKTKGNLSKDEAGLLKQSLMALRLAFVEAVDAAPQPPSPAQAAAPLSTAAPEAGPGNEIPPALGSATEEHRPKFSKKY